MNVAGRFARSMALGVSLVLGVVSTMLGLPSPSAVADSAPPPDRLPDHIRPLAMPDGVERAQRPEFAPDGRSLYFIDQSGDVWEYQLNRRGRPDRRPRAHNLTSSFAPEVLRAVPLTNGDLVLCAPADVTGGRLDGQMWLFRRPLGRRAPVPLGEPCWEGVGASKEPGSTRIVWTRSDFDFEDPNQDPVDFRSQVMTGRIAYDRRGTPRLVDRTLVVDRDDVACPFALLEGQDLRTVPGRPGLDHEVLFTAYGYQGFEVLGVDRMSRRITNHSRSPERDEAEGVAPGGEWITVERGFPGTYIWRLSLDGDARWEQLTSAAEFPGLATNNPVISPDQRWMAFSTRAIDGEAGSGDALLLFDLRAWDASGRGEQVIEPDRLPPFTPPDC